MAHRCLVEMPRTIRWSAELTKALASRQKIGPVVDAVIMVAVRARDATVSQLDAGVQPKQTVNLELKPLFDAAKIKVDKQSAKAMGLTFTKSSLTTPLLTADQVEALQRRYTITSLTARWAGWVALAALVVSVVTPPSRCAPSPSPVARSR